MAKEAISSYDSLTSPLDMLPDELKNKILLHAPTEDAVRCKTVCKEWQLQIEAWASGTPMDFTPQPQKPLYFMFNTKVAGLSTYAYNSDKQSWVSFKIPNYDQGRPVGPPDLPLFNKTRFNISASGGLVCLMDVRKQDNIYVCNPILRNQIKLLPKAPVYFYLNRKGPHPLADRWSITLSTDIRLRKYDIALIRSSRVPGTNFRHNMTIHLYKSDIHSWVNLHSEKEVNWKGGVSCVICKDVLYSVVYYLDDEWSSEILPCSAIVAYDLSPGKQKQSLAETMVPFPCELISAKLLNLNDKLIMVGGVEDQDNMEIGSIKILEMCGCGWREITQTPDNLIRGFCEDSFLCSGYGNFIFIQDDTSSAVLSYEFSNDIWTFLTEPPFPLPANEHMNFNGFCFEPRLDIVP